MTGRWLWLVVLGSFCLPWLLSSGYYVHLANMIAIAFIFTASLNLIFGVAGQITVGHAAFYGIGAYTAAILMREGVSFWLAVPGAMLAAGLAGFLLGLPCLRLRHYHLAMATMGFAIVFYVVVMNWMSFTGGAAGIPGIARPSVGSITLRTGSQFFWLSCTAAWLTYFITRNLLVTGPGLSMRALRTSESAATALGINLTRTKLLGFTVSTALAGLSGALYASFARYIAPDTFALYTSIVVLTVVVVGGLGSNLGALIGAGLMVLLPEFMLDLGTHPVLLYSAALLLVMLFAPKGLAGLAGLGWRWLVEGLAHGNRRAEGGTAK